jgi:NitT/TauT family transport system permease protein
METAMKLISLRPRATLLALLSFVSIGVLWQLGAWSGLVNPLYVSSPVAIWTQAVDQAASGELAANLYVSSLEFVAGFGLAMLVGVALGVIAGWFRTVEYILDPFIWFTYAAPLVAFYPIFVAKLGLGVPTVITIAFLFAMPAIYANTLGGIQNIDQDLVRMGTSFGAGRRDVFFSVALPASMSMVVAGLRLSIGRALMGVVVAEIFGATAGLGYSITYYGQMMQTSRMMVPLLVVIAFGVVLTQGLAALETRLDWRGSGT